MKKTVLSLGISILCSLFVFGVTAAFGATSYGPPGTLASPTFSGLTVSGNTVFNGTFGVSWTGESVFGGKIKVSKGITVSSGGMDVTGAVIADSVSVADEVTALDFFGNSIHADTIGARTSTGTLTINNVGDFNATNVTASGTTTSGTVITNSVEPPKGGRLSVSGVDKLSVSGTTTSGTVDSGIIVNTKAAPDDYVKINDALVVGGIAGFSSDVSFLGSAVFNSSVGFLEAIRNSKDANSGAVMVDDDFSVTGSVRNPKIVDFVNQDPQSSDYNPMILTNLSGNFIPYGQPYTGKAALPFFVNGSMQVYQNFYPTNKIINPFDAVNVYDDLSLYGILSSSNGSNTLNVGSDLRVRKYPGTISFAGNSNLSSNVDDVKLSVKSGSNELHIDAPKVVIDHDFQVNGILNISNFFSSLKVGSDSNIPEVVLDENGVTLTGLTSMTLGSDTGSVTDNTTIGRGTISANTSVFSPQGTFTNTNVGTTTTTTGNFTTVNTGVINTTGGAVVGGNLSVSGTIYANNFGNAYTTTGSVKILDSYNVASSSSGATVSDVSYAYCNSTYHMAMACGYTITDPNPNSGQSFIEVAEDVIVYELGPIAKDICHVTAWNRNNNDSATIQATALCFDPNGGSSAD